MVGTDRRITQIVRQKIQEMSAGDTKMLDGHIIQMAYSVS